MPALTAKQRKRVVAVVGANANNINFDVFNRTCWILYLDRVCREYLAVHKKFYGDENDLRTLDPMHLNRETCLNSACNCVMHQLKPAVYRPCDGDMRKILPLIQPMVETILDLAGPAASAAKGQGKAWIEAKIRKKTWKTWTFRELSQNPPLMQAWVQEQIKLAVHNGSKDGGPVVEGGVSVTGPDVLYSLSSTRTGRKRATVTLSHKDTTTPS